MDNLVPKPKSFLLRGLIIAAVGLIIGGVVVIVLINTRPEWVCLLRCQKTITAERIFLADELVVSGQDPQGNPLLIRLDLNRRKVDQSFSHYYYADVVYKDVNRQLYTTFSNPDPKAQAKDFLTSYKVTMAEDLSAQEKFDFTFHYADLDIKVNSHQLNGDFLVKNTPEYTKYVSEGTAEVSMGGVRFTARLAMLKIYSSDYSKYVFFEGYDNLKSTSQLFMLWDEDKNFYLLDTSAVDQEIENYRSHTWVLYKHNADSAMRKAFFARTSSPPSQSGIPSQWTIDIPEIDNSHLELQILNGITQKKNQGIVSGTVVTEHETKTISGYFSYNRYE